MNVAVSRLKRHLSVHLLTLLLVSSSALAQWINPDEVLFGHEPTFQDQEMVNEPGRMTMSTPHKKAKFDLMIAAFLKRYGPYGKDVTVTDVNRATFKPGVKIEIPGESPFIVDMEPVCIEWNQLPLHLKDIANHWQGVYAAAAEAKLVPYVNPAAERSGMGHIHVGGNTIAENPFLKHPLLLRNMMVYFHQHPSLLWGFAEAYDIGSNSNIESYHSNQRQKQFQAAVEAFDTWYAKASEKQRVDGAFKFLGFLDKDGGYDFFQHYRFINLEHIRLLANSKMATSGKQGGKYTVEFRNIRPFKTAQHAQSMAEFLMTTMNIMANPNKLVKFKTISAQEYMNFHSHLIVANDWMKVKKELKLADNPIWNEMQAEYVNNMLPEAQFHPGIRDLRVIPTYSEKNNKGKYFELVVPDQGVKPKMTLAETPLFFQAVSFQGLPYWVTVVNKDQLGLTKEDLLSSRPYQIQTAAVSCESVLASGF